MTKRLPLFRLLALAALALQPALPAQVATSEGPREADRWRLLGSNKDVGALGGANGTFVASLGSVLFAHSRDSVTWHPASGGLDHGPELADLTFANGRWVAVGESGLLMTSDDGVRWTNRWTGVERDLRSVAYGNGRFVAVGSAGLGAGRVILSSLDGVSWIVRELSPFQPGLVKVVFAERKFVAIGYSGAVLISTDGIRWTSHPAPSTERLSGLVHVNGEFVALGREGVFVSDDALSWRTNLTAELGVYDLAYGNGRFVAAGNDERVWTSTNGFDWEWVETGAVHHLTTVKFVGDRFLIGGKAGTLGVSINGLDWRVQWASEVTPFHYLVSGNGRLAAFGSDFFNGRPSIASSSHGRDWTVEVGGQHTFVSLSFAGDQFIAFAHDATAPRRHLVITSQDGDAWQVDETAIRSLPNDVAYGNGVYVGSGSSLFVSPDGRNWTTLPAVDADVYKPVIEFGNGRFVAIGVNSVSYVSGDGTNWTARPSPAIAKSMAFGNGCFVAVGYQSGTNFLMRSADGVNWARASISPLTGGLNTVAFGGGLFVAAGSQGTVLTSADGLAWQKRHSDTELTFLEVAFHQGRFVATTPGVVLEWLPFPSLKFARQNGLLQLEVSPLETGTYALESTLDLNAPDWRELKRLTNSTAPLLIDLDPAGDKRFFRLLQMLP